MDEIKREEVIEGQLYEVPSVDIIDDIPELPELEDHTLILKNVGEYIGVEEFCSGCGETANHILIKRFEEKTETKNKKIQQSNGRQINKQYKVQLFSEFIHCENCGICSIRKIEFDKSSKKLISQGYFIPKRINRIVKFQKEKRIPTVIFELYSETIDSYNSSLRFSCAACIRSLLEQICVNRRIKETMLNKKMMDYAVRNNIEVKDLPDTQKNKLLRSINLKDMLDELSIDISQSKSLSESSILVFQDLREIFNDSVHGYNLPSIESLDASITIIEYLINTIYIERGDADQFNLSANIIQRLRR